MFIATLALASALNPRLDVSGACTDLVISNVTTGAGTADPDGSETYPISVTVKNLGPTKQAGNTLDSVGMYFAGERKDVKGLQPLGPGKSQTVVFNVQRSSDAGAGTSRARFRLMFKQAPPECHPGGPGDTGSARY